MLLIICLSTCFVDLLTSKTLNYQKRGLSEFFLQFFASAHILSMNCDEMAGDQSIKTTVYEIFLHQMHILAIQVSTL